MNRRSLLKILGLPVSLGLLALMIHHSGTAALLDVLTAVHPGYLAVLFTLQVITILGSALLWQIPLRQSGYSIGFSRILRINMAGSLVEALTPSVKFGGEAVKLALFKNSCGCSTLRMAALAGVHTYLWMMPFMLISSILVITQGMPEAISGPWMYLISFLLITAPVAWRILKPRQFSQLKCSLTFPLALSALLWLLYPVKTMIAMAALGIQGISYFQAAGAVFGGYLVGLIPLFPGGLGGFESAMSFVLVQHGLTVAEASATALVTRLGTFWFPLLLSIPAAFSLAGRRHTLQPMQPIHKGVSS